MFLLAGAVFGALLSLFMSGGYETVAMVLCEVRQFGFFFFVVRTRGMSFGLLWLRLCHCDWRFMVCLPCVIFLCSTSGVFSVSCLHLVNIYYI